MGNIVAQWVALLPHIKMVLGSNPGCQSLHILPVLMCVLWFSLQLTCRIGKLDMLNFVNTYDYVTRCDSLQVCF